MSTKLIKINMSNTNMTEIITNNTHTIVNVDGQIDIIDEKILLQNKINDKLFYVPYSKEVCNIFNIPHSNVESSLNNRTCDSDHHSDEETENSMDSKLWTRDRVIFLIDTIEEYIHSFDNGVKKIVWEKTAQVCASEFGKVITNQQVESKWKSLKRTYNSVLLNNSTSGKQRRYWEYFNKIHNFMYKRPEIIPKAVCSSSEGFKPQSESNVDDSNAKTVQPGLRANNVAESSFCKKRRQRESEAAKRHKEKLARMDRVNDLFEKMVEKM